MPTRKKKRPRASPSAAVLVRQEPEDEVEPVSVKIESGQQRYINSIAGSISMTPFATPAEYKLMTMKEIYDEDRDKKRRRTEPEVDEEDGEEEEEEEEEKEGKGEFTTTKKKKTKKRKKAKKALSTSQEARQRLQHTRIDQREQKTQTQIDPTRQDGFMEMLQALHSTYPEYQTSLDQLHRGESTNSMLQSVMTTPRAILPVRSAELESKMLKQCGKFFDKEAGCVVDFPPCNRGAYCMTSACHRSIGLEGLDEPVILMASMNEDQYRQLLREGSAPAGFSAMCVLCSRFTLLSLINEHKARMMKGDPNPVQVPGVNGIIDNAKQLQSYFNLKDQIGGYRHEFMIEQRKGDPVSQPLVAPNLSALSSNTESRTGRLVIDQSALVFKPVFDAKATPAAPGVRVKDFLARSKKVISPARLQQLVLDQKGAQLREVVRAFLLRHQLNNDPVVVRIGQDTVDSMLCEQYSRNPNLPPKLTFICAQLTDVIIHLQQMDPNKYMPMRHVPWTELEANDSCWSAVCTDVLLDRSLPNHMQNAAFFSPLADLSVPILQLITKCCVNVRCQSRTLSNMVRQWLISIKRTRHRRRKAKQPHIEETVVETYVLRVCKEMVCCGLLGGLIHSHAFSRPPCYVRSFIYALLADDKYNRWWFRLFERSPSVLVNCVRSYMIWTLDHNPALLRHSGNMMSYPKFRDITEAAMDVIRVQFAELVLNPVSSLHQCLSTLPPTPCAAIHLWYCGHKKCLVRGRCEVRLPDRNVEHGHEERPDTDVEPQCALVVPGRGHAIEHPPRPGKSRRDDDERADEAPEDVLIHGEKKDTTTKTKAKTMNAGMENRDMKNERLSGWQWSEHDLHKHFNTLLIPFDHAIKLISYRRPAHVSCRLLRPMRGIFPLVPYQRTVRLDEGQKNDEKKEEDDYYGADNEEDDEQETLEERASDRYLFPDHKSSPYVPDNHLFAARTIVASCGPVGHGNPFYRVLKFFPFFGVKHEVVAHIRALFLAYEQRTQAGQPIQRQLWELRTTQPHAYNLIHIFSELLDQAQRRMHMVELPMHILRGQVEGVQEVHQVLNRKGLLDRSISFTFCHVCLHIYSNIRDSNSVYKNTFNHGLLNAKHSYLYNKDYCTNTRSNHRGQCGKQELVRIPLLGRMLWFRQKMIMICPQPHCGQLMALDPKEETYVYQNERGPSCIVCSTTMGVGKDQQLSDSLRETHLHRRIYCVHCAWPHELILENWKARMYGQDRYLCHHHHNPEMDQCIVKELKNLPREAHNRCIDRILAIYEPREGKDEHGMERVVERELDLAAARSLDWYEPMAVENRVVAAIEDPHDEHQQHVWEEEKSHN